MPKYEAAIFNSRVRDALRRGDFNDTGLDNEWQDTRYVEVTAANHDEATDRVERKYPPRLGFVITSLRETS